MKATLKNLAALTLVIVGLATAGCVEAVDAQPAATTPTKASPAGPTPKARPAQPAAKAGAVDPAHAAEFAELGRQAGEFEKALAAVQKAVSDSPDTPAHK